MPGTDLTDDVGSFDYELATGQMTWSDLVYELHGLQPGVDEPSLDIMVASMCPEDRDRACAEFRHGARAGGIFSVRYRIVDRLGDRHELVVAAEAWGMDGDAAYVNGFVIDVTGPLTEHMRQAVAASAQHRAVIEQAKGVLMLALRVPEDGAFRALRGLSNTHNVQLATLAEGLLEHVARADPSLSPTQVFLGFVDSLDHFGTEPATHSSGHHALAAAPTRTPSTSIP